MRNKGDRAITLINKFNQAVSPKFTLFFCHFQNRFSTVLSGQNLKSEAITDSLLSAFIECPLTNKVATLTGIVQGFAPLHLNDLNLGGSKGRVIHTC